MTNKIITVYGFLQYTRATEPKLGFYGLEFLDWHWQSKLSSARQSEWDEIIKWSSRLCDSLYLCRLCDSLLLKAKQWGVNRKERRGKGWARLPAYEPHTFTVGSHEIYSLIVNLITIIFRFNCNQSKFRFSKVRDQQGRRYLSDLTIINCFISKSVIHTLLLSAEFGKSCQYWSIWSVQSIIISWVNNCQFSQ